MFQNIVQFFKDMSPQKLIGSSLAIFAFLVIFGVYVAKIGATEFAVLYSDLEMQDSAKIVQELERRNLPYQAIHDGSVIKVHKSEVVNIRLALAQEGLPNAGSIVGYEIFDKEDSIGATNFSQNIKLIRALEGELSRTITAFEQVEKARVHLVMPQREIFSKEKMEPRASVVLKFKGLKRLGKSEIDAISHLVVTSVPGLEMKGVTIVDTKGVALKIGSSEESSDFGGGKNEEVRVASEERLRQIIENLLESTLGAGKVRARVALEMNFDRIVTNSELYDPDSSVARSVHSIDKKEQTPVASADESDVSVANNIPGGANGEDPRSKFALIEESDQITNYEISKTVKNHISESGLIKKMSIGILVDGQYTKNLDTKEMDYTPRSKEDLDKIANLVKVAVGFDDDRSDKLEVINMKFSSELDSEDDDNGWLRENLSSVFQTLVFAIVVLLVLITVIRPIALKAFEVRKIGERNQLGVGGEGFNNINSPLDENGVFDPDLVFTENVADSKKVVADIMLNKVSKVVDSNPQDLVNILRKWLNEGN
jgi:flagellar M-ring protein FliF